MKHSLKNESLQTVKGDRHHGLQAEAHHCTKDADLEGERCQKLMEELLSQLLSTEKCGSDDEGVDPRPCPSPPMRDQLNAKAITERVVGAQNEPSDLLGSVSVRLLSSVRSTRLRSLQQSETDTSFQ